MMGARRQGMAIWLVALSMLVGVPVAHGQGFTACETGAPPTSHVGEGDTLCYDFTGSTDSRVFSVSAPRAFVDFDPDVASTGGAGTIYLVRCTSSTASTNSCLRYLTDQDSIPGLDDLPLNGDELTNRRRIVIPPGWWYIDVQTSAGGVTARAVVTGGR